MRFVLCVIALFVFSSLSAQEIKTYEPFPEQNKNIKHFSDKWFANDKAQHFMASAFLSGVGYYASKQELNFNSKSANITAVGFSFSFGIAKEIYDKRVRHTFFSYKDIVADLAGIAFGVLLINVPLN